MIRHTLSTLFVILAVVGGSTARAVETDITIRVISRDAKFVGSSVGGAHVTVSEAQTGVVLAQGVTEGGTGDTDLIMKNPRKRNTMLATEDAAKFSTVIDLERPTRLDVRVIGPMSQPHAANTVTASQWVLPGRGTDEEGWILELPGLIVDIEETGLSVGADGKVAVRATVRMMCGCPLKPGGLWDSDAFEISALLRRDGEIVERISMQFAGEESKFEGTIPVASAGRYDVEVWAYQPSTGNAGFDVAPIAVR